MKYRDNSNFGRSIGPLALCEASESWGPDF